MNVPPLKTLHNEGPLPAICAVTGPLFRVVATETRVSGRRALDAETRVSGRRALMLRRGCRADAPWC